MVLIAGLTALLCWAFAGFRTKRYGVCIFTGLIWMLLPYNFYNIAVNHNMGVLAFTAVVPLMVYVCFDYIETKSKIMPFIAVFIMAAIRQFDAYTAAVVSGCMVILLIIWKFVNEDKHGIVAPSLAVLLPNIITVYEAVTKKGFYRRNFCVSEEIKFFSLKDVFYPLYNFRHSGLIYYLGIFVVLLAIFGVICSHRKTNIVFLYGILLLAVTINPLAKWFVKVSGFRADRLYVLIIMSYACICVAFILWDTLKVRIQIAVCILLCFDIIPSAYITYQKRDTVIADYENDMSDSILQEAQKATKYKMIIAGSNDGSKISENVAEAMDLGEYLYVFDRSLAAGYDTVVLQKSKMRNAVSDIESAKKAAKDEGYEFITSNSKYILFYQNECKSEAFEVKNHYKAIGIGERVHELAMIYPQIYETDETNIEKYTVSELSGYDTVYLSGFTYDNKDNAQEIVRKTAESGTRVVINADNMPYDKITRNKTFLDVTCNSINFENGYPALIIDKKEVLTELFDKEHSDWQGVYVNGLKKVKGYFKENGKDIAFLGSLKDKNINFVGINLISHYATTYDDSLKKYIDKLLVLKQEDAPVHEIVIKG